MQCRVAITLPVHFGDAMFLADGIGVDRSILTLNKELKGSILDIGGGGEGVIGRLYKEQVTAIDNRQEELDEAPDCFNKVLMDAAKLDYGDGSFDHVTFFYTLMYMPEETQREAIREAARVMKGSGSLHIWDCEIESAYPEPFCTQVEVCLPGERISATYGIVKRDIQSFSSISRLCAEAGLTCVETKQNGEYFYLRCAKEDRELLWNGISH